ncbi:unnamed protein product [Closterium sp. Naga37s-1]|nr:unnamed protein product [Closterium sp. Naga37s-1]
MKPSIKGIKDEWVLHRVLLPRSVKVHVGDVLCVSLDTATTAASHSQVRPQATTTLYSHTISVNAHTPAELPTSRSSSSIAPDPCNTTTVKEEPCDSTVTARPTVVFRRVAAVAGDEIESPQPSDAPFRIEDNHFWVVADNPDVPAQEAWDSRTFGPVHVEDVLGRNVDAPQKSFKIFFLFLSECLQEAWDSRTFGPVHLEDVLGRALYVGQPVHLEDVLGRAMYAVCSKQAMEEDAAVMAGEGDLESVMQRVRGMQLR